MPFGTLQALDDLENVTVPIAEAGLDEATFAARVREAFDFYNRGVDEAMRDFAVVTSNVLSPYGVLSDDTGMQELDEFGVPDVDKTSGGGTLGLPLRFYGKAKQWTRLFVLNTPVSQLTAELDEMASQDMRNLKKRIIQTLVTSTNSASYYDRRASRLTYDVKALLNADGMSIPLGPNGETFDGSTHTHYLFSAALTDASLAALIDTVVEHGVDGGVTVYINRAQESTVRGLTGNGGFFAYMDTRIQLNDQTSFATGGLDVTNPADRAIGLYYGAEIWVKPFVPANYQIAFDNGAGANKPLGIRTRSGSLAGSADSGGFGLLFENDEYPLRARAMGREFGVGVLNRHKAAVNYSNSGSAYTIPTITG